MPQRSRQSTGGVVRRQDPYRQFEDLYDLMNQLMQDVLVAPMTPAAGGRWIAPADIEETEDAYLVEVDVPGVAPEDIDLALRGNELRITGEIKERERKGILRRRMRKVGQFELIVALPGEVDPDKVEAQLHDGVLTVRLQKATTARDRHIEITNGQSGA
jgi:HSP20 family protein